LRREREARSFMRFAWQGHKASLGDHVSILRVPLAQKAERLEFSKPLFQASSSFRFWSFTSRSLRACQMF
ncbi:MAG: hypothetical protein ACRC56_08830, partial [Bosea sp. (in: a-proteobacteria)]